MWRAENWLDYELLDCSDGERLERWGKYVLIRPDPQVIWKNMRAHPGWSRADGIYRRSESGGGSWNNPAKLPEEWKISYAASFSGASSGGAASAGTSAAGTSLAGASSAGTSAGAVSAPQKKLTFIVRPTGFKHTGVFPEQAVNWEWFGRLIRSCGRPVKVLNLFAYTGGATVAAAAAGASVCHVDAAKGMVAQAKANAELSGLSDAPIRYIVEDCRKFVERELRRGSRYDAVIMDPPSYGRGPSGEMWKLEDNLSGLVESAAGLLSGDPLFFLINSYTAGLSPASTGYVLKAALSKLGGKVEADEIGLPVTQTGGALPCGSSARWQKR